MNAFEGVFASYLMGSSTVPGETGALIRKHQKIVKRRSPKKKKTDPHAGRGTYKGADERQTAWGDGF
jgi:hypothetical protein